MMAALSLIVTAGVTMLSLIAYLLLTLSPPLTLGRPPFPNTSSHSRKPPLILDPETSTFKIAIFTDLHYGEEENGWGIDQDIRSTNVTRSVLHNESPDLVVVNGDLITGENTFRENSTGYVAQVVQPMVEFPVPWASTYGNHDSKFNLSREELFAIDSGYELSYTQRMDRSLPGITNYYLLVYNSIGARQEGNARLKPAVILWFFDSRGGASYQHSPANKDNIPNWVAPETAAWFSKTHSILLEQHGAIPSVAFVHIPPHSFLASQSADIDPSLFPGVNDDIPVDIEGEGTDDDPFVDALLRAGGMHSIHVGHDHGNAWCSTWPDPRKEAPFLCFGKHTGYGGYGNWNRGSRILHLSFNEQDKMQVDTWVRMENGDVVTRVSLNGTYGVDRYPTANGE